MIDFIDWLIDKRDTLKMDELERKSLIDSMREMNEWISLIDLILFVCQIELIEMNEKALNALWLSSC